MKSIKKIMNFFEILNFKKKGQNFTKKFQNYKF